MEDVIEQAKEYQYKIIEDFGKDPWNLKSHVPEVEKWAKRLCKQYPAANKKTILIAVWLHDTGWYIGNQKADHAVKSERAARKFLTGKIEPIKIDRIAKIIRYHRCRDVKPETFEEKIFACADSASHMTDYPYLSVLKDGRFDYLSGKIKRDYRDLSLIPEVKNELTPLYRAWRKLIQEYRNLGIVKAKTIPHDKV